MSLDVFDHVNTNKKNANHVYGSCNMSVTLNNKYFVLLNVYVQKCMSRESRLGN